MKDIVSFIKESAEQITKFGIMKNTDLFKVTSKDIIDSLFIEKTNTSGIKSISAKLSFNKFEHQRYQFAFPNPDGKNYTTRNIVNFEDYRNFVPANGGLDKITEKYQKEIDTILDELRKNYKSIYGKSTCKANIEFRDRFGPCMELVLVSPEYQSDVKIADENMKKSNDEYKKWANEHPYDVSRAMGYGTGRYNGD